MAAYFDKIFLELQFMCRKLAQRRVFQRHSDVPVVDVRLRRRYFGKKETGAGDCFNVVPDVPDRVPDVPGISGGSALCNFQYRSSDIRAGPENCRIVRQRCPMQERPLEMSLNCGDLQAVAQYHTQHFNPCETKLRGAHVLPYSAQPPRAPQPVPAVRPRIAPRDL